MSARREKRLRKLEEKLEYMNGRVHALEFRVLSMEEKADALEVQDADWAPAPPRRSLWRRLLDAIMGRDEP